MQETENTKRMPTDRARVVLGVLAALLCAALLQACAAVPSSGAPEASGPAASAIAAYVGDATISEDEVSSYTAQFRETSGLEDDESWARYLQSSGLDAKTWREHVIRLKADRMLVERKAAELGIAADEEDVEERIAALKERVGAANDEAAWRDYLAQSGKTSESLRDEYEFASVEQQLLVKELDLTDEVRVQMCDDYLKTNFADQVVRHYLAFEFSADDEGARLAQKLQDELSALDPDELKARFAGEAQDADVTLVDLGWDFAYDEDRIDPDLKLRRAKVGAGELFGDVLEGEDVLRVVYCAEREEFGEGFSYEAIESDSLKSLVADLTMTSQWTALATRYLADLESEVGVQVVEMPQGLDYDVADR